MGALAVREQAPPLGGRRAQVAIAALAAMVVMLAFASLLAPASSQAAGRHVQRLCGTPRPGTATCQAMRLVSGSVTAQDRRVNADRRAREIAAGAKPQVNQKTPIPGFLTPQLLHTAYSLPNETAAGATQTVAVVDAFNDPTAEADLGVFDEQFGLAPCTTANGCFRKLDEQGKTSPLPANEGEWASEISIDVQMARAICQSCHILLVEANSESFNDLGTAVNAAVAAGATEVSNSYAGPEEPLYTNFNQSFYNHPGIVIAASSGDCGYLNKVCRKDSAAANFPASSPDVVGVGGTSLTESSGVWTSTVWNEGGSGCSTVFGGQLWQLAVANFAATGCGGDRAVADVSAIGDPNTGVDVYDSTPETKGAPTGWGVWGGTSVASPIVAAEWGLAGGSHGVSYPAATLYSHAGEAGSLYDVLEGANGTCLGATICNAASGYDGPTGVGSPIGLGAFATAEAPESTSPPTVSGEAVQGQTLQLTQGTWSNEPTNVSDQWEDCNAAGEACAPIGGQTGSSYLLAAHDVGSTIRVLETASNGSGSGAPALSAPTAVVASNVLAISGLTPLAGITGSNVQITGSGFSAATQVAFGALSAQFVVLSGGEIEATVPNGAKPSKVTVTTAGGKVTSKAKFKPTLSITGFSPSSGPTGRTVKIRGVGFNASTQVSFSGVPAGSVTVSSSKKLTATVPAGAGVGPITVTNSAAPVGTVQGPGTFAPS